MTYQSRLQDQSIAANQRIKEQNYWLNKLSGQWTKTMFPVDYNKKTSGTPGAPHMEIKTFRITGELFAQIMKLRNNSDSRLFMILVAVVTVLLYKYTGNKDILLGSPVLKQDIDAEFVNTTLVLRNPIRPNMSFKELLLQVRQTVLEAVENQNYPVETLPRQLDMTISGDEDFPLYDIAVLVENIHDINYLRHIKLNMIFSFLRGHQYIEGTVEYHPALYDKETIERIANHFTHLLGNLLANIDTQISNIEILEEEKKKQLLFDFNNTEMAYPGYKNFTIQQLFDEQVKRTPAQKVLSYNIDLSDIYKDLEVDVVSDYLSVKYEGCYFKKNPYVFKFTNNDFLSFLNISDEKNPGEIILLNTHKHDYIAVNQSTLAVVDCFNGKRSLKAIFTAVSKKDFQFLLYPLSFDHIEGASREEKRVRGIRRWPDLLVLIKMLYRYHLIELVDFEANPIDENSISDEIEKELNKCEKSQYAETGNEAILDNKRIRTVDASPTQVKSPVLLLGDTTGTATVGLLYLASYLRRHSIEAFCQWNDLNGTGISLKRNVEKLLTRIGPRVVGISMKWFQHIARVLEICRTVKNFDSSIEIVLGGNTAAYYWENFIRYEFVDYIVLGDGEVPLLKICKNEKKIPNCIYREGGQIIHNSITYIQDETDSSDIYLSHLDEIFVSKQDPFLASSFMVYTGKGCSMSCFYCGGCLEAQKRVYNRARPFLRGIEEIRKDIKKAQKYTSTLMFDFDLPNYETLDYYRKIFAGIDLSHHFCEIYFWKIPSAEFIELITGTFKYVYFSIDVASLSERHRAKLANLGVVKPQATDEELFRFFEQCEKYENVEVAISQIAGLPYFNEEDIEASHRVLSKIIDRYGFFTRIDWGRLHAQPGAPLADTSQAHGMKSYAQTFADYLGCSELNFKEAVYPGLDTTHYPFIYYEDDNLNSKISKYFADTEKTLKQFKEKKEQQLIITKTLTYEALNREANLLARLLRQKGVGADTLAAIMVRPSPEMIIGILAILKAGGAYLPIDPAYPASRVRYMLADSGVDVLLTDSENNIEKVSTIINLKDSSNYTGNREADLDMINRPGDTAYIIYTSGTTGRPKGVGVEHRSAVNTLLCRKAAYQMNEGDVTLQLFSYAFDGFVTSFFTPVISGAKVVLPNDGEIKDIARIRELIRAQRVTHFISVPSLFRVILDGINRDEFTSLKAVTLAGEKLLPGTLELAKQKLPSLEIANEYGVTETAVMSTIFRHQEQHQQIKIGKPVWNTCIYIVGEDLKLRPVGVPGEMCIAGAGVARGYLNQPELTAERFKRTVNCHLSLVISPFEPSTDDQWPMANDRSQKSLPNAHSPHSPIYLTGDQARWLPDGNIQFLGRIDQQVKIRGYRIELSEIENQL
jgi:amino acid adenylation domain-containing protein